MKCPKCEYLGFETGDRCKNCGYDFSLLASASAALPAMDLPLRGPAVMGPLAELPLRSDVEALETDAGAAMASHRINAPVTPTDINLPRMPVDLGSQLPLRQPRVSPRSAPAEGLPLFRTPLGEEQDDAPLVRLPATPRAPLAVRKTPATPRLRALPRTVNRPTPAPTPDPEPELTFQEPPPGPTDSAAHHSTGHVRAEAPKTVSRAQPRATVARPGSTPRRLVAALIDHVILASIDLAVVYFTVRMVGIGFSDWVLLPKAPLVAFLVLIKLAYFCAFTALGGQTIGKMAARIRVVSEDGALDGGQAARRALVGALSALTLGLGFLPGLFGERRALHDRAARTRVVGLESA